MKILMVFRVTFLLLLPAACFSFLPGCELCRTSKFPPSLPDQICLTWTDDPSTTQTVQWRTSVDVAESFVEYKKSEAAVSLINSVPAEMSTLNDPLILNAPSVNHFTAKITGLDPATTYLYRVGSNQSGAWSNWTEFRTSPQATFSYSFFYIGDVQEGLDTWSVLLRCMGERHPAAAFCITVGDLVNNGNDRTQWDTLFNSANGFWSRHPILPAIGNHEYGGTLVPSLYLDLFALPANGPETLPGGHAYSVNYGNSLFIVLDSNQSPERQRGWIENTLAESTATWKFVSYHHPAYSSDPNRDNPDIREQWCGLFDKYHVDMVFQGHDHAYLRTYPVNGEQVVSSPSQGTIYVVSTSGSKFYAQAQHDYTAVGLVNISTYQVIDIQTENGDSLTYRAYGTDGTILDELAITKNRR